MNITLEEVATYIDLNIKYDGEIVGRCAIKVDKNELCSFEIFEPFQNKGYGTSAFKEIVEKYNITNLCVKGDNERAKKVYSKCNFKVTGIEYEKMEKLNEK